MARNTENVELFHVTRRVAYNQHQELVAGSTISAGAAHNPFFAFYETTQTLPVQLQDGSTFQAHMVFWMEQIASGQFTDPDSARKSVAIVKHFQMLSRELGLELVRREVAPDAPSRMSCLWTTRDKEQARFWAGKLVDGKILRLNATGTIHEADASLMATDSESYDTVVKNAHRYWRGEHSENPEPEVLFAGKADVVEIMTEW